MEGIGLGIFIILFLVPYTFINLIWFLLVYLLTFLFTGNSLHFKKPLVVLVPLSIIISFWTFVGILGYYTYTISDPPPFSYLFSPYNYNIFTQFLLPGIIIFIVSFISFRYSKCKHILLAASVISLFTLPWIKLYKLNAPELNTSTNKYISRKDSDILGRKITATILGEELLFEPKYNSKILRISTKINVPYTGQYKISFVEPPNTTHHVPVQILEPINKSKYEVGTKFSELGFEGSNDYLVKINSVDELFFYYKNIKLKAGENELIFDFPLLVDEIIDGKITERTINRYFLDGANGVFGPYRFQFSVKEFYTDKGVIRFTQNSPTYQTKSYTTNDFKL